MEPTTLIKIISSVFFVTTLFIIIIFIPQNTKAKGIKISTSITILLILFFIFRPFWLEYQIGKKEKMLTNYLEVQFKSEKDWIYGYSVKNKNGICQNEWTPPEGKLPKEGKHFEKRHCE